MGAIQRGGELRLQHITAATVGTFREFILANVSEDAERVMRDQHPAYPAALGELVDRHEMANHIIHEYCWRRRNHELNRVYVLAIQARGDRAVPQALCQASAKVSD